MEQAVKAKINEIELYPSSFGQNCEFVQIVLSKFKKEEAEKILTP